MALISASAALALVVIAGGFALALHFNFHRAAPDASYPTAASPLEAQQQDVDYFAKVVARDRAFSPADRQKAEARIAALRALPSALPSAKLHVALMQVMALADNGHSRIDATSDQGTLLVPLRVTRFAEGFYVTRAAAAYRDMLGGRVVSIDGHPIDQILLQLDTLRGGVEPFRQENDAAYISVQDLLYGLGVAATATASTWTVVLPDGRTVTRPLDAYSKRKDDSMPLEGPWLSPELSKGAEQGWSAYHPQSAELPQTWRDLDNPYRIFPAAGSCAQVVQLQSIGDVGSHRIAPFLNAAKTTLRANPPCAVILDLRGDGGGDYTNTWHFAHALPNLIARDGRILVLTNSQTFSAAITTAAFVKDAGGDRVTIIGEPVGDRLSFFSEGSKACLPNLKVCVYAQTAKHDYQQPCENWRVCFWLNWFYPVRVKTLQPDIVVPLRFEDWNMGKDAAFETARQLALLPARKM